MKTELLLPSFLERGLLALVLGSASAAGVACSSSGKTADGGTTPDQVASVDGGAGSTASPSPDGCGLTANGRALVEKVAIAGWNDAHMAAGSTADDTFLDIGFSLSIVGVQESHSGIVTYPGTWKCVEGEITCLSTLPSGTPSRKTGGTVLGDARDGCTRTRCEGPDILLLDVYLTMRPTTNADERHPFTYDALDPAGTAVADPNPRTTWRYDFRDRRSLKTSSESERALVFTIGGERLDASSKLVAAAERGAPDVTVDLPRISTAGVVSVKMRMPDTAIPHIDALIRIGDRQVATLDDKGGDLKWTWTCGP